VSTLLYSLGRWSFRHPWRVLLTWVLLLVIAGGAAAVFGKGTDNAFSIPGTESQAGLEQLSRTFPQAAGTSAQIIVVAAPGQTVDESAYTSEIANTVTEIGALDGVLGATDPFGKTVNGLVSDDKSAAIISMQFNGQVTDVPASTKTDLQSITTSLQHALPQGATAQLGGDLFAVSVPGISITEAVGLVIALLVLLVTFRSFLMAGMPLGSALIGVAISMSLILGATAFASVSSTTPLLALMLGLAVGIDYALFIAARHQDQVRAGVPPEESAARATGTAGSAVVFAGITVLIALIGLGFANIPFLTTMGIAAALAVAIAVIVAITLTPAFLGFAKGRVVGWSRRPKAAAKKSDAAPRRSFSTRWAGVVTKHPLVTTIAVIVTLGVLAIPAASLQLALPNAGVLPKDNEARKTYDLISEHFGPGFNGPLIMTGTIVTSTDPLNLMKKIGDDVATLPGVKTVALATPNETADTGIVQIIPTTAPDSPETAALVRELRAQHDHILDTYGVDMKVTGFTAVGIDISDRLGGALLPFGIFVVGLSLVLLMVVFRSIWVPIKAALGYLLSVGAAFGVVSAVFVWGWGADLIHVAKVGPIISFMPIVLMGVLFGLAMDYQVFLVSRMREDFVHAKADGRTRREVAIDAVRSGYTGSARVVTAAATIMFAVFAAFIPEGDSSLKPIALGLASGILFDAFLVRMTLVPAVMALLGAHAWWMPRWLGKRLPHFDIEGEAVEREIALADWPDDADRYAVAADALELDDERRRVYTGVDVRLATGDGLLVTAEDPRATRALLLTIAGRLESTGGRLRVAGHLLPGRNAWARRHSAFVSLGTSEAPLTDLRRGLRRASIVVIDGIDRLERLTPADRDQALALLREGAGDGRVTLVASAPPTSVDDLGALLRGARISIAPALRIRTTLSASDVAEVTA
jgi:RND superfamily putative drug exporter